MSEQTISGYGQASGVFRIGDVLSRGFAVIGQHFPLFFLIYLLSALPGNAVLLMFGTPGRLQPIQPNLGAALASIGGGLLGFVLTILGQSMVRFIAYGALRNQEATLGEAFERAWSRFFPVLGALICFGFAMLLGILLLVVPGLMIAVRYYVSPIVCLVERRGPIDSLGRSAELTSGYRWPIFGLALLVVVVSSIITVPIGTLLPPLIGPVPATIISMVTSAALGSVNTVIFTAAYHALRLAKEGGDGDHLAQVFD